MRSILHNQSASYVVTSLLLIILPLAVAGADLGGVLSVGVAGVSAVVLLIRALIQRGRKRSTTLVMSFMFLSISILLITDYSLVRDHVRWLLFSGHYKAGVLARPDPVKGELKHAEWDGWGFAGMTVFLAFDPADSLAAG